VEAALSKRVKPFLKKTPQNNNNDYVVQETTTN